MAMLPSNMNTGQQPSSRTRDDIGQDQTEKKKTVPQQQDRDESELSGCESAKRILRERLRNKQKEYLVLFTDGSKAWCDFVTPGLLQHYGLLQERQRQRRRQRRTGLDRRRS